MSEMNQVLFLFTSMCILYTIASVAVYITGDGSTTRGHYINAAAEETRVFTVNERSPQAAVRIQFDPYGMDTIVYIHIQKTGGSEFLEHLVTVRIPLERVTLSNDSGTLPTPDPNTQSIQLCRTSPTGGWKRGKTRLHHEVCPRDWEHQNGDTWLISEKTTAWNCGVHPFYTDFKNCLQNQSKFNQLWKKDNGKIMRLGDNNRFHYVAMLRHPILRYVSEYLQVSRGACWQHEDKCRGKNAQRKLSPGQLKCPDNFQCKKDIMKAFLTNLTLETFVRCTESWSINRMTLMLADHELATCWDKKKYSCEQKDRILLESAKSNLRKFSYFGINEFFVDSGSLFEETFGVSFGNPVHLTVHTLATSLIH